MENIQITLDEYVTLIRAEQKLEQVEAIILSSKADWEKREIIKFILNIKEDDDA